jgi:hypothetical protein
VSTIQHDAPVPADQPFDDDTAFAELLAGLVAIGELHPTYDHDSEGAIGE